VPSNAEAVTLNIVAVQPQAVGYVTVYPCGSSRPNASNLNVKPGVTLANVVIANVGTAGEVCIYTSVATHLIADVNGLAPAASQYFSAAPVRFLESRSGLGFDTFDGNQEGIGLRAAGTTTQLDVGGRGTIPMNTPGVALNVTAIQPTGGGFVTVYPCGVQRPNASSLNLVVGAAVPNAVVSGIGVGGKVCIYNSAATHLVVDVVGLFPLASHTNLREPARYLETRTGRPEYTTVDHDFEGDGIRPAESVLHLRIAGRGGLLPEADFVWLNVTAVQSAGNGFITVYPCTASPPTASNLNVSPGRTVANAVLAELDAVGDVCIYTSVATHLLVDLDAALVDGID